MTEEHEETSEEETPALQMTEEDENLSKCRESVDELLKMLETVNTQYESLFTRIDFPLSALSTIQLTLRILKLQTDLVKSPQVGEKRVRVDSSSTNSVKSPQAERERDGKLR